VRSSWIEDGIWNSEWVDPPGKTWIHEKCDEEEVPEVVATTDHSIKWSLNTTDENRKEKSSLRD